MDHGLSQRQASSLMGISRRALTMQPAPDKDVALRERLRAVWRPNMGYRMAHSLIRLENEPLNVKRVHRVWKEEKLGRMKRYRKKRTGGSVPLAAEGPNHVWCVDFCFDWAENRSKLKVLAIQDEFTKEILALEVATSIRSLHLQEVLSRIMRERGAPQFLRSDNGPEFISRSLAVMLAKAGTESRFIKPGSPWQNGFAESLVSRLRDEILGVEVFHNLADAQLKLAIYRRYYNEVRPHSSLGRVPPVVAARRREQLAHCPPSNASISEGSL
ncbi:MAG: IS3 family transposase [Fimbriimonadaceae bacterium]|nr:IS3 family transposase [Fimbriimonadaceae bacterium]